eukprot:snap_masked-scaffold395_size185061-processed-gene-0.22 protein:Tk08346 transcript:snap_masked-scaffold395_size185061-processed-gene-0.22-mRNA-1 annotation:"unnamed protein product"
MGMVRHTPSKLAVTSSRFIITPASSFLHFGKRKKSAGAKSGEDNKGCEKRPRRQLSLILNQNHLVQMSWHSDLIGSNHLEEQLLDSPSPNDRLKTSFASRVSNFVPVVFERN